MEFTQIPLNDNHQSTSAKGKHDNTQRASLATVARLDFDGKMLYEILLTPRVTLLKHDELRKRRLANGVSHSSFTNGQQPRTSRNIPTALNESQFDMEKEKQSQEMMVSNINEYTTSNSDSSLNERNAVKSSSSNSLTDIQVASPKEPPELRPIQLNQTNERPKLTPLKQPSCEGMATNKPRERNGNVKVDEPANKSCLSTSDQDMPHNGSLNNGYSLPNIQVANRNDEGLSVPTEVSADRWEAIEASEEKTEDLPLEGTKTDIQSLPGAMDVVSPLCTEGTKIATKTISEQHDKATQDSAPKGLNKYEAQLTGPTRESTECIVVQYIPNSMNGLSQANSLYEPTSTRETSPSRNNIQDPLEVDRSEKGSLRGPEQDAKTDGSVRGKRAPLNERSKKSGSLKDKTREEEEAIAAQESRKKERNSKKKERERKKAREQWENKKKMEQAKQELKEARRREQEKLELKKLEEAKKVQTREPK
ncbi:hypothetical protein F4813DRAFT_395142 [Daldinia decipiens]|uniref:uncharacterized protein n=1 Tax=Daldinia decipiens TaxID=326647 RepID=UPI0020C57B76|nr:uncharacterized protein F4813DRAFT_395142 [Daldinia decipiens]KAI1659206.1 hypothetical protein F4813DRAFT_395142 [Daldinia decipiens]